MCPQARQMQLLAARGWLVISVQYRVSQWPVQLHDAIAAYRWMSTRGVDLGLDLSRITVGGASAGGHLLVLTMVKVVDDDLPRPCACVLYYPALDVEDVARATVRCPFSCKCLCISKGQSLLAWFFEVFVLRRVRTEWPGAGAVTQLLEKHYVASQWPPTLVLHGDMDSVVPIEHSQFFLALLAQQGTEDCSQRPTDMLVVVPGGRHTYDIVHCRETEETFLYAANWLDCLVRGATECSHTVDTVASVFSSCVEGTD